jgi:molecular chaperone HtpG
VFIMEDTGQLMPVYLRFVRGVIDSSDLPLNVSRELLQSSRAVDNIRSNATRKVLRLLKDLAEQEPAKYATFWAEFGAVLKEGVADDYANRDAFRAKGIEVLLLGHPVDNWVVSSLSEFGDRKLQSVTQGTADFGALQDEAEQQAAEQASAEFAGLVSDLKASLAGAVWDVRVSTRLTTSPACIVANEPDLDLNLAHRLRGTGLPRQPVLEINPQHPLIRRLNAEPRDPRLTDWAHVLFNQAVLTLGAQVEDPAAFITSLNALLVELTGASPE